VGRQRGQGSQNLFRKWSYLSVIIIVYYCYWFMCCVVLVSWPLRRSVDIVVFDLLVLLY
jgi:hypothetical protein